MQPQITSGGNLHPQITSGGSLQTQIVSRGSLQPYTLTLEELLPYTESLFKLLTLQTELEALPQHFKVFQQLLAERKIPLPEHLPTGPIHTIAANFISGQLRCTTPCIIAIVDIAPVADPDTNEPLPPRVKLIQLDSSLADKIAKYGVFRTYNSTAMPFTQADVQRDMELIIARQRNYYSYLDGKFGRGIGFAESILYSYDIHRLYEAIGRGKLYIGRLYDPKEYKHFKQQEKNKRQQQSRKTTHVDDQEEEEWDPSAPNSILAPFIKMINRNINMEDNESLFLGCPPPPIPNDPRDNTLLTIDCRETKLLGRGCYGSVFYVKEAFTKRKYTIKVIPLLLATEETQLRELEIATILEAHFCILTPGLVRQFGCYYDPLTNYAYIIMEYIPHFPVMQRLLADLEQSYQPWCTTKKEYQQFLEQQQQFRIEYKQHQESLGNNGNNNNNIMSPLNTPQQQNPEISEEIDEVEIQYQRILIEQGRIQRQVRDMEYSHQIVINQYQSHIVQYEQELLQIQQQQSHFSTTQCPPVPPPSSNGMIGYQQQQQYNTNFNNIGFNNNNITFNNNIGNNNNNNFYNNPIVSPQQHDFNQRMQAFTTQIILQQQKIEHARQQLSNAKINFQSNLMPYKNQLSQISQKLHYLQEIKRLIHNGTLDNNRQFTLRFCMYCTLQLTMAVDCLHHMGIAHRDIKHTNLMIVNVAEIPNPNRLPLPSVPILKLLDYGLSKYFGHDIVPYSQQSPPPQQNNTNNDIQTPTNQQNNNNNCGLQKQQNTTSQTPEKFGVGGTPPSFSSAGPEINNNNNNNNIVNIPSNTFPHMLTMTRVGAPISQAPPTPGDTQNYNARATDLYAIGITILHLYFGYSPGFWTYYTQNNSSTLQDAKLVGPTRSGINSIHGFIAEYRDWCATTGQPTTRVDRLLEQVDFVQALDCLLHSNPAYRSRFYVCPFFVKGYDAMEPELIRYVHLLETAKSYVLPTEFQQHITALQDGDGSDQFNTNPALFLSQIDDETSYTTTASVYEDEDEDYDDDDDDDDDTDEEYWLGGETDDDEDMYDDDDDDSDEDDDDYSSSSSTTYSTTTSTSTTPTTKKSRTRGGSSSRLNSKKSRSNSNSGSNNKFKRNNQRLNGGIGLQKEQQQQQQEQQQTTTTPQQQTEEQRYRDFMARPQLSGNNNNTNYMNNNNNANISIDNNNTNTNNMNNTMNSGFYNDQNGFYTSYNNDYNHNNDTFYNNHNPNNYNNNQNDFYNNNNNNNTTFYNNNNNVNNNTPYGNNTPYANYNNNSHNPNSNNNTNYNPNNSYNNNNNNYTSTNINNMDEHEIKQGLLSRYWLWRQGRGPALASLDQKQRILLVMAWREWQDSLLPPQQRQIQVEQRLEYNRRHNIDSTTAYLRDFEKMMKTDPSSRSSSEKMNSIFKSGLSTFSPSLDRNNDNEGGQQSTSGKTKRRKADSKSNSNNDNKKEKRTKDSSESRKHSRP